MGLRDASASKKDGIILGDLAHLLGDHGHLLGDHAHLPGNLDMLFSLDIFCVMLKELS